MNGKVDLQQHTWVSQLFDELEQPLLRYVRQITGDAHRAEDVVQDAFARLCRQRPAELRVGAKAWLYTVCRNRALDICRKERRVNSWESINPGHQSPHADPAEVVQTRESSQRALGLLRKLPANQQEAIRLRIEHQLSYREISEVLETSVSHVGYLLHCGLKSLRTQLAHEA